MNIQELSKDLLNSVSGGNRFVDGVPTPEYLSIPDVKSCLDTKSKGSYSVVCIPDERPEACPIDSWEKLQKISGLESC